MRIKHFLTVKHFRKTKTKLVFYVYIKFCLLYNFLITPKNNTSFFRINFFAFCYDTNEDLALFLSFTAIFL